ncbi:HU family DNA-binding protein [uncultured Parabacteroides sp.]|jgi:predicted histone-like DNA-binding protein|uniref:HU family DNA-binding protein n=1 Tax=uncultured Parabacteroides sp. TaxID=512312 RepID=UPI0025ED0DA2|nr:HU family DNA-binding protein [uncultured Parabacteroides sp.]
MSIIYKPRKMVCTIPGKEKTGYFAAKANSSTINLNDLCYRISSNCTITSADIKGVIEALMKQFELELLSGKNIQFGDIGIFSASITSDIVDNKDDLKPQDIRIKTVTFLPSTRLKTTLKNKAKFMRLRDFNRKYNGVDEE